MTRRPRGRDARPTLPCIIIARSPANDARVILDALVSTPALVRLLTDRDGWVSEHRAELRALLQQLTNRLGHVIEGAGREISRSGVREEGDESPAGDGHAGTAPGDGHAVAASDQVRSEGSPSAARSASRTRRTRHPATPRPAPADDWGGGPLLR